MGLFLSSALIVNLWNVAPAAPPVRSQVPSPCARERAFARDASALTALESDTERGVEAVVRRSVALAAVAAEASEAGTCRDDSTAASAAADARAHLLRLWARVLALRATDEPIYPSPHADACQTYDLASVRFDAREAWVERNDSGDARIARPDLARALDDDSLSFHVASLAIARLRLLGESPPPGIDAGERAWLAESSTALEFARSALPVGEHCGPTYALYGVEPETAAYAPLRHRGDGSRVTALR